MTDKTFRDGFLQKLEETQKTLPDISRETGVSLAQLRKLAQREQATTNVDDAYKIAQFFELPIEHFLTEGTTSPFSELKTVYAALRPELKEKLLAYATGLKDGSSS